MEILTLPESISDLTEMLTKSGWRVTRNAGTYLMAEKEGKEEKFGIEMIDKNTYPKMMPGGGYIKSKDPDYRGYTVNYKNREYWVCSVDDRTDFLTRLMVR